jgi:hypothetical protein
MAEVYKLEKIVAPEEAYIKANDKKPFGSF